MQLENTDHSGEKLPRERLEKRPQVTRCWVRGALRSILVSSQILLVASKVQGGENVCPSEQKLSEVRRRKHCYGSNQVTSRGLFRYYKLPTKWPSTGDTFLIQSQQRLPSV